MLELFIQLATKFWQFTVLGVLILVGFLINISDRVNLKGRDRRFSYEEMPHMQPITIPTKDKGFFGAVLLWILTVRTWKVSRDFKYKLDGQDYIIPEGFVFDGASVPKFLASFLSPVGVLLIGGLVHDYAYKFSALRKVGAKKGEILLLDKSEADRIFRDINIEVNGFHLLNYLTYWTLRAFGFLAWRKHRKVNAKMKAL
jgi:hypothetical protein